jgi:DNA-binding NarL/FixJ family response regulator
MKKRVVLVGHCGPDNSYLRMAVAAADKSIQVISADDSEHLVKILQTSPDLLLLNRELSWGFAESEGVELIRHLRTTHPDVKTMLVSNYPEAQAEAVDAGASLGFGKREIGSPRVGQVIRDTLSLSAAPSPSKS